MKRMSIGDAVIFKTTNDQPARGFVVELIVERRQPTMVLIERLDGGRAIRLENEVELADEAMPVRAAG
jgi:hypothetical protein